MTVRKFCWDGWFRIETNISKHYKTYNLMEIIDKPVAETVGYLVMLFRFAREVAWRDGNLEPWGIPGIERECGWTGRAGLLVDGFQRCGKELADGKRGPGYLVGLRVNDWEQRLDKMIRYRMRHETGEQPKEGLREVVKTAPNGRKEETVAERTLRLKAQMGPAPKP